MSVINLFKAYPFVETTCNDLTREFTVHCPMTMNFLYNNKEFDKLNGDQKKRAWMEIKTRVSLLEKQVSFPFVSTSHFLQAYSWDSNILFLYAGRWYIQST